MWWYTKTTILWVQFIIPIKPTAYYSLLQYEMIQLWDRPGTAGGGQEDAASTSQLCNSEPYPGSGNVVRVKKGFSPLQC